MKNNWENTLKNALEKLHAEYRSEADELRKEWEEAGCPTDDQWSIDLSVDSLYHDYGAEWDACINRFSRQGCPDELVDAATYWW